MPMIIFTPQARVALVMIEVLDAPMAANGGGNPLGFLMIEGAQEVAGVCLYRGGFKWLAQSGRLAMGQGLCEASGSIAKPNRKPYEPLQPPDPRATLHP